LARFAALRLTSVALPANDSRGTCRTMRRLEDYHTVTGFRRASGKIAPDATVQTYRHYLLDARFGVLLEGSVELLTEISTGLRDPRWGIWLGRKSCIPASPLVVSEPDSREVVWKRLLAVAGGSSDRTIEEFDHVVETDASDSNADMIEDIPIAFGNPIGERHAPRWIQRIPKTMGDPDAHL
jgi:CRISPR system Cascade subunit CasD